MSSETMGEFNPWRLIQVTSISTNPRWFRRALRHQSTQRITLSCATSRTMCLVSIKVRSSEFTIQPPRRIRTLDSSIWKDPCPLETKMVKWVAMGAPASPSQTFSSIWDSRWLSILIMMFALLIESMTRTKERTVSVRNVFHSTRQ